MGTASKQLEADEFQASRQQLNVDHEKHRERLLKSLAELRRQALGSAARIELLEQARQFVTSESPSTLVNFLPRLLKVKDSPFTLDNHFPFEPFFHTLVPQMQVWKTGRQVSKSTNLAASGVVKSNIIPNYNTLFVTPLFEMIRRFSANYVRSFIDTSPLANAWTSAKTSSNVLQRSFRNGSTMHFSYALLDADRTRGLNCDELCFDEVQDLNVEFIPIIREVLSGSPHAIERFCGTPKTTDGTLEQLWLDSSQAEWCIKCTACNKLNVPCLSEDLDRMIGEHRDVSEAKPGVICAKCARPINPRSGRWIHRFPERAWDFAGRHVPQILLPMHYASPKKWGMLLDKKHGRGMISPSTFYNEVLGESYDTSAKLVSETDLRRVSILNVNSLEEAKKARLKYDFVVLAADWGGGGLKGGKKVTSWTAYALMGWNSDGTIDVIYGHRSLTPHDIDGEAKLTLRLLNEFHPNFFVHDFTGAGRLREQFVINGGYPYEKVIPMWLVPTMAQAIVKPAGLSEQNVREHYKVDKPRSLGLTCSQLRRGRIRFFQYDHELGVTNVARDFLSLIEDKIDSRLGRDVYTIIRDANRPDDFAQAVNLGAMAMYEYFQAWPDLAQDESERYGIEESLLEQLQPTVADWQQN